MSTKTTRSGGKFKGSHTTVIETAGIVADIAAQQPEVTKVTPGFIRAGLRPVGGKRRVKITARTTCLSLSVRENGAVQEIIVYSDDKQRTIRSITSAAEDRGIQVCTKT